MAPGRRGPASERIGGGASVDLEIQHPFTCFLAFSMWSDICATYRISNQGIIHDYSMSMILYGIITYKTNCIHITGPVRTIVLLNTVQPFRLSKLTIFIANRKAWKTAMPECRPV